MLIAFSTVACNLTAFLTNGDHGSNNFKAADFVGGFRSRKGDLQGPFAKLEPQVFHLGKDRPLGESGSKFQLGEAEAISDWIEREMAAFIERLPDRTLWREDLAVPEVDGTVRFHTSGIVRQQTTSSVGVLSGIVIHMPKH